MNGLREVHGRSYVRLMLPAGRADRQRQNGAAP